MDGEAERTTAQGGGANRGAARVGLPDGRLSVPVVAGVLLGAVYLAVPTARHSYDAVAYALEIERALIAGNPIGLWHEYHILYNLCGFVLQLGAGAAGLHPLMTLQMANAVVGGLVCGLLAAHLRAATGRAWLAASGALLLGFSGSFWYYSTNAEPYVPCVLLLLLTMRLLRPEGVRPGAPRKGRLALAALACALAIGFHLAAAVVAPLLGLSVALRCGVPGSGVAAASGRTDGWGRDAACGGAAAWGRAALFLGIAGLVAGLPYAWKWTRVEPVGIAAGVLRFLGDLVHPGNPVTQVYLLSRPYSPAIEIEALLRGFAPIPAGAGGAPLQSALGSIPVALTILALAGAWRAAARRRLDDLLPFAAFCALLLFFAAYNAGEMKFTVFLSFFLVCAAIPALHDLAPPGSRAARWLPSLPAAALLLAAGNYAHVIRPWSDDTSNRPLAEAGLIREHTAPPDGLLIIGRGERNALKVYVPYFAQREAIILDFFFNPGVLPPEESLARVRRRLRAVEARGGEVYALADIIERSGDLQAFLRRNGLEPESLNPLLAEYAPGPALRLDGTPLLYPLRRLPARSR